MHTLIGITKTYAYTCMYTHMNPSDRGHEITDVDVGLLFEPLIAVLGLHNSIPHVGRLREEPEVFLAGEKPTNQLAQSCRL